VNVSVLIRGIGGWLVAAVLLAPVAAGPTGCSGACANAKDLCEQCELNTERCKRFDDLPADDCQAAVDTYEASCAL
jgi:hypothetical protein